MPFTRLLAAVPCCFKDSVFCSLSLSGILYNPLKMAPNSHITTRELCERNRYCAQDSNHAVFPLPARHRHNRRLINTDSSTLSVDSRGISLTQLKDTRTGTSLIKLYTAGRAVRKRRLCFLQRLLDLFFVMLAAIDFILCFYVTDWFQWSLRLFVVIVSNIEDLVLSIQLWD